MTFRLMSACCVLLLAGCTSSEPQNASYAPVTAAPAPQATQALAPAASPMPELQSQPTAFPPTDPVVSPQADTDAAAVLPPGASNCSTVDGVTLCDAPPGSADSSADAFGADDTLHTN